MTAPEKYKTIPLTQGQISTVDASEYPALIAFNWFAVWDDSINSYYAATNSPRINGKRRGMIMMHRMILGLKLGDPRKVDHRDRDTLNNRRSNLRIATNYQNIWNAKLKTNNKSGYKGVCWNRRRQKWIARIGVNYTRIYLGAFDDPKSAHAAYCAAAKQFHGEFARTA